MNLTNNYFTITEIIDTPTGKLYSISWKWYFPKGFLKNLTKYVIDAGWMQSGEYSIKHDKKKTHVQVHELILKDFAQVVLYLAKRYQP